MKKWFMSCSIACAIALFMFSAPVSAGYVDNQSNIDASEVTLFDFIEVQGVIVSAVSEGWEGLIVSLLSKSINDGKEVIASAGISIGAGSSGIKLLPGPHAVTAQSKGDYSWRSVPYRICS